MVANVIQQNQATTKRIPTIDKLTSPKVIELYSLDSKDLDELRALIRTDAAGSRDRIMQLIDNIVMQKDTLSAAAPRALLAEHLLQIMPDVYTHTDPVVILDDLLSGLEIPERKEDDLAIRRKLAVANIGFLRDIFILMRDHKDDSAVIRYLYFALCQRFLANRDVLLDKTEQVNPEYLDLLLFIDGGYNPISGEFDEERIDSLESYIPVLERELFAPVIFTASALPEGVTYPEVESTIVPKLMSAATNVSNLLWLLTEFDPYLEDPHMFLEGIDQSYRTNKDLRRQIHQYSGHLPMQNVMAKNLNAIPESNIREILVEKLVAIAKAGIKLKIPSPRFYNNVLNGINNLLLLNICTDEMSAVAREIVQQLRFNCPEYSLTLFEEELAAKNNKFRTYWAELLTIDTQEV
jgi:hypothetical protein